MYLDVDIINNKLLSKISECEDMLMKYVWLPRTAFSKSEIFKEAVLFRFFPFFFALVQPDDCG